MAKSKMLSPGKIEISDAEDKSPDAIVGRCEQIITMKISAGGCCMSYQLKEEVAAKLIFDLAKVLEARFKKNNPEAGTHKVDG